MNIDIKTFSTKLRGKLSQQAPLAQYTTWHVGGTAKYLYEPKDFDDLIQFFKLWPNEHKIMWLGGGSNILIRDTGINATVIHVSECLNKITKGEECLRVEAGVTCTKLIQFCLKHHLVDGVFLASIPGSVGGALAMNAGAFGSEIWQHVVLVETIDRAGIIRIRQPQEFNFGYRQVTGLMPNEWFIAGHLQFKIGDVNQARQKIRANWQKRLNSQPIREFSCGSVFKNPEGHFAGHLIELCGLKGLRIGGAKVSDKHANFIINEGNATSADIEQLMHLITSRVFAKYAIRLEPEVKIVGEQ
jgi:UDP-N-acetylmuramate dehydrogenase